ncbi:MAG: hypothetical protein ORN83_05205 [Chthoniobacteraceae bacterium]|nr:hypothetical protein [Chthoniobacteraceae bacterium]
MKDLWHSIEGLRSLTDRREAYQRLAALYIKGPRELRELVREKWDFELEWTYPDPKRLACRKNERYSCEERIMSTLVYDSIEDFKREEIREKLIVWAVVYHSCREIGMDPCEAFIQVAEISSPRTAQALLDFIKRLEVDKSMEAFGLSRKLNSDGESEILLG